MRRLLVSLLLVSCTTATPAPSPRPAAPTALATVTPTPAPSLRTIGFYRTDAAPADWFETRIAPDWYVQGPRTSEGRVTFREHVTISNRPVADRKNALTSGAYEWMAIPRDAVVLRAETMCGRFCSGSRIETPFPLDWSKADSYTFSPHPAIVAGFDVRTIGVRFLDETFVLWAYLGPEATVRDEERLAAVATAVAPTAQPPARGEFRGWTALGPAAERAVGGVWSEKSAGGASFYLVNNGDAFLAFPSIYEKWTPRPNCAIRFDGTQFVCDPTGDRWTRSGKYLGSTPASDLPPLRAIVRDGIVFVR